MGPQVQVGVNPQKPLTNRHDNSHLRDGLGVEVMQLHPIVVRERPHEVARRHPKPPLMEGGETDHVPRRRSRVGLAPGGQPLRLRPDGEGTEQTIGNKGLQILHCDGGERPWVARRNDGHLVSHRQAEAVEAEGMRCVVFSSLSTLLGCENKSRRQAQMTGKRTTTGPSSGYIKARARSTQNFARTLREFQTRKNCFSVPRTTRARATDTPRVARPVKLTPWQGTRHLWQAKRAPFRLRHDDRLKKGVPHCLNLYHFSFYLSLSCHRDRERGYFERILLSEGNGSPSPPTDQGFERCALRGSATALEHSGSEPFTDQGFKGWPLGGIRQPPQSMQSQG
jgi:hypothetical protein